MKSPRLSSLSRQQLPQGSTLGLPSECGFCAQKSVTSIASVKLCLLHKNRVERIQAEAIREHRPTSRKPLSFSPVPFYRASA